VGSAACQALTRAYHRQATRKPEFLKDGIVKLKFLGVGVLTLGLAACGGGGSGSGSGSSGITTPPTGPTTAPRSDRATATISFRVPAPPDGTAPSSSARSPRYISPGTDKLTLIIDGVKAFNNQSIFNTGPAQTYTSSDGNTVVVLNNSISGADFVFVATIDTLPGNHTFGVALISGTPAIVMSEGQATYALLPGPNNPQALTLKGVIGSGYIQCDSDAHNLLGNGCANSFNTTTALYTLTAVAADYNGFPIPNQTGVGFDNGSTGFSVVATSGGSNITLSNNGPFTTPGTQLTAGPSGSWYVDGAFTYGQPFNVQCVHLGTATLGLTNPQQGPTSPLTGLTYTYFPPNPQSSSNYPGSGALPTGSKTHTGTHPVVGTDHNAVTNLATVNCDASLQLTLN
jgi:hypothetical protein